MKSLNIAASASLIGQLQTARDIVPLAETDFTDVAALVVSPDDVRAGLLSILRNTGLSIPAFVAIDNSAQAAGMALPKETSLLVLDGSAESAAILEAAADEYQRELLPPFFDTLTKYVAMGNSTFACPGHQGERSFASIPPDGGFTSFSGKTCFAPTCAMPM
ncbi:Orn/Lys/Arg decarboxylase N-terminal domain-containing protein [Acerihabitans sp. KWT182]|uniref:Orn/Lys/Arg decarboxylase N-terminal domain-containing protein n=1 Tax=Acerihabitans sp. KWT182 TaxID=3157919 RepID=A0AAU7QA76_9GAMM